jgi:hypothetical protein
MEKNKIKFILTSFRDDKNWEGLRYSISPVYPEKNEYGVAKPLEVPMNIWETKDIDKSIGEYEIFLKNNRASVELALDVFIKNQQDVILCCWCHPSKVHEEVSCHRESLGKFISKYVGNGSEVIVADIKYNKKERKIEGKDRKRKVSRRKKVKE